MNFLRADNEGTVDYKLNRFKDNEAAPVFKLRILSSREYGRVMAKLEMPKSDDAEYAKIPVAGILLAFDLGLTGWSNTDIPFNRKNKDKMEFSDMQEIGNEVFRISMPSVEEEGK